MSTDFVECETCKAKPGMPLLCPSCLNNQNAISRLHNAIDGKQGWAAEHERLRLQLVSEAHGHETMTAEVGRLQAIVDRLQKCWRLDESGKLVRDVPLVPGMKVRTILGETFDVGWCRFLDDSSRPSEAYPDPQGLYLTAEAADAARKEHCPGCGAGIEEGPREDGYTRWACGSTTEPCGFVRSQPCWESREAAREEAGS